MLTKAYSLWEDFTGESRLMLTLKGKLHWLRDHFFRVQDVTAKDKTDEKEKENRKWMHLLECNTTRERENSKEEM